ncbi:ABC transporter substrate-binding protein [Gordonia sp. NPDC003422]
MPTSRNRPRSRTRTLTPIAALLAALLAAGLFAGCSAPEENDTPASVSPVTIADLPGQKPVVIPAVPQRIVAVGTQWIDTVLAFGVTPVGYLTGQTDPAQKAPWTSDKLNSSTAITSPTDPSAQITQIAKLNPDLILVPSYAPAALRDQLAALAPTIGAVSASSVDPWDKLVTVLGTALREPEKATELINGVNEKYSSVKTANPGLADKTYSLSFMYTPTQISVLGDPNDGAGQIFTSIGLKVSPTVAAERARQGNAPRFTIGLENVPVLDANLVLATGATPQLDQQFRSLPGYSNLAGVKAGAAPALTSDEINALNTPSVLSIPWVLDRLNPALAATAKQS